MGPTGRPLARVWSPALSAGLVAAVAFGSYALLGSASRPDGAGGSGVEAALWSGLPPVSGVSAGGPVPAGTLGGGQLAQPMAVAVGPDGRVYVADAGRRQVVVLDSAGTQVQQIGRGGLGDPGQAGDDELYYPVGVALAADGRIFVADLAARRILVFAPSGEPLGPFATGVDVGGAVDEPEEEAPGVDSPAIDTPAGLYYRDGLLYVPDVGRHVVHVLDDQAHPVRPPIGDPAGAGGPTMLRYPNFVYVAADGGVYVADSNNDRVCLFNANGVLERIYSAAGAGAGRPAVAVGQQGDDEKRPRTASFLPRGLALDSAGQLHVAGALGSRVLVFGPSGDVRFAYGESQPAPGLQLPNGLAIAGSQILVADRGNQRLATWEYAAPQLPIAGALQEVRSTSGR